MHSRPMEGALRYALPAVVLAGALPGCAGPEPGGAPVEVRESLLVDDPRLVRVRVNESFDAVWSGVTASLRDQGLEETEAERTTSRETYTTTVSLEDQPRDRTLRETVTEGYGKLVAESDDGKLVAFELQEEHQWGMSALQLIDALAGGDEDRRLEHDGVLITVPAGYTDAVDPAPTRAVFDALVQRFSE